MKEEFLLNNNVLEYMEYGKCLRKDYMKLKTLKPIK